MAFSPNLNGPSQPTWSSSQKFTFTPRDKERVRALRNFKASLQLTQAAEHKLLQQLTREGFYTLLLKVIVPPCSL